MTIAQVGQPAPSFRAPVANPGDGPNTPVAHVALDDYAAKWLVFFWYTMDFTAVCPTEITALSDRLEEFKENDCEILGASTDSVYSHRAWMRQPRSANGIEGTSFPLVADMTHEIARDYGVLIENEGVALRGLFIIDPDGILQYSTVNNINIGRSVDETLRVLQGLQTGGFCPSDWKPGQKTLKLGE